MPRSESVARLANSRIVPDFFWFRRKDLKPFLAAAEAADEDAIVRVYPGLNEEGHPDLHLTITKPGESADGAEAFDFSHNCPPDCP